MRVFFVVFGISMVLAIGWGWWIVQGVRVTAQRTDTQMRTLAWATLAYADEHGGQFPTNEAAMRSIGVIPESIRLAPGADEGTWPTSRREALLGQDPASLEESFRAILVAWGADPTIPPYFKPDGLPTLVGTNTEVNGWLDAVRKRFQKPATGS
jgi:hypothetical protein